MTLCDRPAPPWESNCGPLVDIATTWRLYDAGVPGARPLIAQGAGACEPVVLDQMTWSEVRKRIEEIV